AKQREERRPRKSKPGGGLERLGGRRTPGRGEQRDLSQKRARTDREVLAVSRRRQVKSPRLDHETALRLVADVEQHLAAIDVAGLRADRQNAQGRPPQETERRHAFEEGDVVVDGHGGRRYGTHL